MLEKRSFRTIWVSDFHLGTRGCQVEQLLAFLRTHESQVLYLVGDIFDGWRLTQSWHWPESHSEVLQELLRKSKEGTTVTFIPGNHDEFARRFIGLRIGDVTIARQTEHLTVDGRRLKILHGDEYDWVIRNHPWLGLLGTRLLAWMQLVGKWYCSLQRLMGFERHWSLAACVKRKSKQAQLLKSNFLEKITADAAAEGFDGVICGHVHHPEVRALNGVWYYNDGDWVDHCSALVEHDDGRVELLEWPVRC